MVEKVFTLVQKKVVTADGEVFFVYKLMTSHRHWYSVGVTDKKLRAEFEELANKVVVCEVERKQDKKHTKGEQTFVDPTLYISSIRLADGEQLEAYNAESRDYNSTDLVDL